MNITKKTHILFIHDKSAIGGGEMSLLNLWENLNAENYKIFLIIPDPGPLSSRAKTLNVDVSFFNIPKLSSFKIFKTVRVFFSLRNFIIKNNIQLIHTYTPRNNIIGALLGRSLGIPVIWHERNLIFANEPDFSRRYAFLPNRIICNSKAVSKRFANHDNGQIPSKVRVVLNGVHLSRFSPRVAAPFIKEIFGLRSQKIVGIVSALTERKRINYFIEAAARIIKQCPQVTFLIVGAEFYNAQGTIADYKSKTEALGLTRHVIFTGFREDVSKLIPCFNVSAHVTKKEACSRAIMESLACGIPVVAMDDGGNAELIENGVTGLLSPPDDMDHFVHSIVTLLNDDTKRLMMGRRAREAAEKLFDVRRNTKETEAIYKELIK